MRVRVGEIRRIIREEAELDERAMGSSDATGLALLLNVDSNSIQAVLYRADQTIEDLVAGKGEKELSKNIVASIDASKLYGSRYFSVDAVAADGGWGPFMYDIAMANSPGLAPDRFSVSKGAKQVWSKYAGRGDVEAVPLESKVHLHGEPELDNAYVMKGSGPDVSGLVAEHQRVVKAVREATGNNPNNAVIDAAYKHCHTAIGRANRGEQ